MNLDPRKIKSPIDDFFNSLKIDLGFGGTTSNSGKSTRVSLANFKAQVTDFARPNRFSVEVYPPKFMVDDIGSATLDYITVLAQSAFIPPRNQGEVVIKYHGMELKLPGDYTKENLSITFLNDYDFVARQIFENWMEFAAQQVAYDNMRTHAMAALKETSLVVNQIGRTDSDILASYKFYDVFPTSISAIELDMSQNDQVERFTVNFAYSYYEAKGMY